MLRGEALVAVSFFGDGASNIGAFHEGVNLAAVKNAPVIFVWKIISTRVDAYFTQARTDFAARARVEDSRGVGGWDGCAGGL